MVKYHRKRRMSRMITLTFGLIFVMIGHLQATVTQNQFSQLEKGDSITGELFRKPVARSSLDCSVRYEKRLRNYISNIKILSCFFIFSLV